MLHAHDWQAGLAPVYLAFGGPRDVGTVMTVHNIAFQGWADVALLGTLRLPAHEFHPASLEYYGGLSSLKAGLVHCDKITTVSPSYAAELMRPEFGLGLQGLIAGRAADVEGILNGVDAAVWSPDAEPGPYTARRLLGKAKNRAALCAEFGLEVPGPLAIVVSRLTDQKGIDLLPAVPSVVFGLWGIKVLAPAVTPLYGWLVDNLGWIPLFAPPVSGTGRTILTVAIVLAVMIIPIITAITREVFLQTPVLHEEAALALGATRWEMIQMAVLPFGRPGIISGRSWLFKAFFAVCIVHF